MDRAIIEAVGLGHRALRDGRPFEAHEHFEDAWRLELDPTRKSAFKGLAQLAAAMEKARRGEPVGHHKLWTKARARLEADVAALGPDLVALVEAMPLEPPGPSWSPPADLAPGWSPPG